LDADAFLATILNGDPDPDPHAVGASSIKHQRHRLDYWENYLDRPVRWIDAFPSPTLTPGAAV
jgi:hypothetical protein